jgi:hypothetical protein
MRAWQYSSVPLFQLELAELHFKEVAAVGTALRNMH